MKRTAITSRPAKRKRDFERELDAQRPLVEARSGGVCERCHQNRATVIHHKAGRRVRNANALHLLAALCAPCHRVTHDYPERSYALGWLVHWWEA